MDCPYADVLEGIADEIDKLRKRVKDLERFRAESKMVISILSLSLAAVAKETGVRVKVEKLSLSEGPSLPELRDILKHQLEVTNKRINKKKVDNGPPN